MPLEKTMLTGGHLCFPEPLTGFQCPMIADGKSCGAREEHGCTGAMVADSSVRNAR